MEYMFLIHTDESSAPDTDPGSEGFAERMTAWFAYNQVLVDGGHFVAGASLLPSTTGTLVDLGAGGTVTDGPFTETKEQLGGFYVVSAADLDEALVLAGKMPVQGVVEVRPVAFRPDA